MISVCLASYNGENFIAEQITSILLQLGKNDELIISDDNSSDATQRIVADFNDDRIRFVLNPKSGVVSNFENAISKSKGEYIFLSDQDDVWLPNKVQVSLACIKKLEEENPNLPLMVFSDATVVDEHLNVIVPSLFNSTKEDPNLSGKPEVIAVANRILGCTMLINRQAKECCLPIQDIAVMHDWWIALSVAKHGIIKPVSASTILYRQHGNNVIGANVVNERNKFLRMGEIFLFNKRIYKMSAIFFPMNLLKYIYLKVLLRFR